MSYLKNFHRIPAVVFNNAAPAVRSGMVLEKMYSYKQVCCQPTASSLNQNK